MPARIIFSRLVFLAAWGATFIGAVRADGPTSNVHIDWDQTTLRLIEKGGAYARMTRISSGILCCFENHGKVWTRLSRNEGKTWNDAVQAAAFEFGNAANPELLICRDHWLILFYNQRPHDGVHDFAIAMAISGDDGKTWSPSRILYSAGVKFGEGCYEPSAIQLASGEIQLFFANEFPHKADGTQEISLLRSTDNGETWKGPQAVSYRAHHRDGMPVPIVLPSGNTIAFAIEDNGLTADHEFKPAIITSPVDWNQSPIDGKSPMRWGAVDGAWVDRAYAGAPYLRQLPGGETILSCQSTPDAGPPQMVVYVGDADAKHFGNPSSPFPRVGKIRQMWNSLFVKDAKTVTAISTTRMDQTAGVWAVDGHIVRK